MRFKKVLAVFLLLLSLFVITSCDNGDVEALKSQNESYISQIEEKDDKIQDLEEQLAQIKAENESLKENTGDSALTEENEKLKSDNSKLETENNNLKEENELLEESNSTLTTENNNLKQSNEDLTEENNTLKDEKTELSDEVASMQEIINQLTQDNTNLNNQINNSSADYNELLQTNVKLQEQLSIALSDKNAALELLNTYSEKISNLEVQVEILSNINSELTDEINELKIMVSDLQLYVNDLEVDNKELTNQVLELSASVESLEAELEELQTKYDEAVNIVTNKDTMTSIIADIDKIRNPLINNSIEISMDDNVELNETLDDCLERIEKLYYYNKVNENEYNSTANYVNTTRSLLCEKIVSLALSVVGEYEYLLVDATQTETRTSSTTTNEVLLGTKSGIYFAIGQNDYYELYNANGYYLYSAEDGYVELDEADAITSPYSWVDIIESYVSDLLADEKCLVTYDSVKNQYIIKVIDGSSYEEIAITITNDTVSKYERRIGNTNKETTFNYIMSEATKDDFLVYYNQVFDYFENLNN